MFEKIKNPNAKPANVVLALIYIAVLLSAFVMAVAWQFSESADAAGKIGF